jgi:hypothetical protein
MAKKRTKAQRAAAAKKAWALRRLREAKAPTPVTGTIDAAGGWTVWDGGPPLAGYEALMRELAAAYEQSSAGKGKERHANGRPFDRQPILELSRLYGPGFAAGQAAKKVQEALSMLDKGAFTTEQALAEVHGGIVYLAAVAIRLRELPAKTTKK